MKLYQVDASSLFLQEDSNNNKPCGVMFLSTKRKALTTARAIAKEAKQFKSDCDKWRKSISGKTDAEEMLDVYRAQPTHEWASGNAGVVNVSLLTAKALPIRTLAETMLNGGDWIEEASSVWERNV